MDKYIHNEPWQEDDLHLPNQEFAWQNMKEKLEEDERKKRVIPPFFLNCAGWATIVLVLLVAGWLITGQKGWLENARTVSNETPSVPPVEQKEVNRFAPGNTPGTEGRTFTGKEHKPTNEKDQVNPKESAGRDQNYLSKDHLITDKQERGINKRLVKNERDEDKKKMKGKNSFTRSSASVNEINNSVIILNSSNSADKNPNFNKSKHSAYPVEAIRKESLPAIPKINLINSPVSLTGNTGTGKKDKNHNNKFIYSAGVGIQQQVPFSGQTAVPYNYYGRKGSLSDYIPSLFLKMEKDKQWFIMGEFRFGAPQTLKELSYNRKTLYDTATNQYVVTTMNLNKTYYHQLPLSFNYYVKPGLSVGVGGMYSRFYGAVTERETKKVNLQTRSETVFRQIDRVHHFTDSFLYKTQVHFLLQAGYEWKRFSLGLRFTKDIQPYIRYTKPNGQVNEEKNQTIQVILRYGLWKSGE